MAIDPNDLNMAETKARYYPNDTTPLLTLDNSKLKDYLLQSTTRIIKDCPPKLPWSSPFRGEVYRGFFAGPTAIAYLFYTLSVSPLTQGQIYEGQKARWMAARYLDLKQYKVEPMMEKSCGITNEYLASNVLKAVIFRPCEVYVRNVLSALREMETDGSWCEWLKGRAGALYLLRLMRKGLDNPDLALHDPQLFVEIDEVVHQLIKDIMKQQPWSWDGRAYLGTVHGDMGIITQIVLSDPSYAPKLQDTLVSLLKQQGEDGNWPVVPGKDTGLVQFCHGAPGMVNSLLAIENYFPALEREIDEALRKGRECIWKQGVLVKEPSICHGITGNALALEGEQKEHFLALATPDLVKEDLKSGRWERDEDPFGVLWGEAGRAWVWGELWSESEGMEGMEGRCPLYSDV